MEYLFARGLDSEYNSYLGIMNSDKIQIGLVSSACEVTLKTQRLISYSANLTGKAGRVLTSIPEHKVPIFLLF
jgi:hypothetical protein